MSSAYVTCNDVIVRVTEIIVVLVSNSWCLMFFKYYEGIWNDWCLIFSVHSEVICITSVHDSCLNNNINGLNMTCMFWMCCMDLWYCNIHQCFLQ